MGKKETLIQIHQLRDEWSVKLVAVAHKEVQKRGRVGDNGQIETSAEHRNQVEQISKETADKLEILVGFHIPRGSVAKTFHEALAGYFRERDEEEDEEEDREPPEDQGLDAPKYHHTMGEKKTLTTTLGGSSKWRRP